MNNTYAILDPENKALNFVVWDGISSIDYGQDDGNTIVSLDNVGAYGFGWVYDTSTRQFIDPNPIPA